MKKKLIFLLIFCSLISVAIYRRPISPKKVSKTRIALGTFIEISVLGDPQQIDAIVDTCFLIIDSLGKKLNYNDPKSALSLVNKQSHAPIFPELYQLLNFSQEIFRLSNKKFDPTVGELIEIWDFNQQKVPTVAQIKDAQKSCGLQKIGYDSLYIDKPQNLKIHLGGVGKGFIVQKVYDYLQKKGVESGYINAGGDILIFGDEEQKIGVTHPRKKEQLIDTLLVANACVVTSGDYERFFFQDGKRYHHIIDPDTGYPSENCVSVSVIDASIQKADALATAFFLLPVDKAIQIADQHEIAVLIYYQEGETLKSKESANFSQYRAGHR